MLEDGRRMGTVLQRHSTRQRIRRGLGRMDGAGGNKDRGPKKGEAGASRKPELRCKASRRPTLLIPLREGGILFE